MEEHWFSTCDDFSLCRVGGNGPINVSQVMPLLKFVNDGESFLDVGCGSGTTFDAIRAIKKDVIYKGLDFIDHRVEWLKKTFPGVDFEVGDARHLSEADKSWDVVWSRHVVDHLGGFEEPMDEHCRVAKKTVICVLWVPLNNGEEHLIKPIIDGPEGNRKTYTDEWTNQYSRKLVQAWIEKKKTEGWSLEAFEEDVVWIGSRLDKGHDTVIVLKRL